MHHRSPPPVYAGGVKILLVVLLIALVIYGVVRVIEQRGLTAQRRQPLRPSSPDDDPDFLRDLDRKQRRSRPRDDNDPQQPDTT